ncbi:hypothetical protein [Rhodococcus sp. RCBS9]|uniref:hypothetical protein n=1 Tax=Rhodococcus sp. RCBS9 TaxID=3031999 RepID=UPI002402A8D3|nr:hypothetical protein [Rhodococcus sp. RCBS9]WEX02782.1 hypothetical protein P0M12_24500 [Rhodococcus sp. RCBS9]
MPNPTKPTTKLTLHDRVREELLDNIHPHKLWCDKEVNNRSCTCGREGLRDITMQLIDTYTQAKVDECNAMNLSDKVEIFEQWKLDIDERESLENVTRFEVIDHRQCFGCRGRKTANVLQKNGSYKEKPCDKCGGSGMMGGRVYGAFRNAETSTIQIEQSFQDDGKTLKIFVKDKENL